MKMDWIDQPGDVRPGEALDVARLEPYLHKQLPDLSGSLTIRQFSSGFSNLTYLIQVGTEEFVLRRPPFGVNIKTAHDMGREYTILSHLRRVYQKAPRVLFYCDDETVLGAPFYVMERVRGVILRTVIPEAMVPPPALMSQIADSFIDNLVELHAVDYQAAGLGNLGRPAGYVQRQIEGWARRYQQARTDDLPELERVSAWLAEQAPSEAGAALIHNDYKYNNLILDVSDWSRILAVLDWEMATLGDPLMDVGTMLGYWIEPDDPPVMQSLRFSPTMLPGNPSREALIEQYIRQSGRDIPHLVFYYVYGVFKLAVIIQQIYRRYKLGFTQDARFAHLDQEVRLCGQIAVQAIEKKRIDRLFE